MTWVIAILKPLQLCSTFKYLFCLFTEKKQNPISAQVWSTKSMISAHIIPKRLVHLMKECSGFDCSRDFFFF